MVNETSPGTVIPHRFLPVINHMPGKVCLARVPRGCRPGEAMGLTDLPILSMLRMRMDWAQTRQRVLSENVANADTPNFRPRDMVPLKFEPPGEHSVAGVPAVTLVRTEAGHVAGLGGDPIFHATADGEFGVRTTGNAVNLEQEMMKVAANTMDYQAVTALYTRSLNLLKTALGRSSG